MLCVNALSMLCIGIYLVRKLGNPILAIRRALDEIAAGNLNVRLRQGDANEFTELYVSLNEALEQVQQKVEAAREETRIVSPPATDQASDVDSRPTVADVEQALMNCRNVLSFFREPSLQPQPVPKGLAGPATDH